MLMQFVLLAQITGAAQDGLDVRSASVVGLLASPHPS